LIRSSIPYFNQKLEENSIRKEFVPKYNLYSLHIAKKTGLPKTDFPGITSHYVLINFSSAVESSQKVADIGVERFAIEYKEEALVEIKGKAVKRHTQPLDLESGEKSNEEQLLDLKKQKRGCCWNIFCCCCK
jgi:hypothetical protein